MSTFQFDQTGSVRLTASRFRWLLETALDTPHGSARGSGPRGRWSCIRSTKHGILGSQRPFSDHKGHGSSERRLFLSLCEEKRRQMRAAPLGENRVFMFGERGTSSGVFRQAGVGASEKSAGFTEHRIGQCKVKQQTHELLQGYMECVEYFWSMFASYNKNKTLISTGSIESVA